VHYLLRRVNRARAVLATFVILGGGAATLAAVARAQQTVRPVDPPVTELRSLADHYRRVTWEFETAARARRTPTTFTYRRSSDRAYLRWTIDSWTRRAYRARDLALRTIKQKLAVRLPPPPALRASRAHELRYSRRLTLALRRIYPGRVTRSFASAHARTDRATLRLWQEREATAALLVSRHGSRQARISSWLADSFLCIHRFEGAWTSNTGNGYYGGLQMDRRFMVTYARDFVGRWGTADNWPVWAQLEAAARAYPARGFTPWPNTARACGLL
jgi:Transglycosylase-like domain